MASGVNSTFRQVGIATGIAALGSIFAHEVADRVRAGLAGTPAASNADGITEAITGGQVQAVITQAPARARATISDVATASFVDALNHITLISAVLAFAAGVLCLLLIRQRDFVEHDPAPRRPGTEAAGSVRREMSDPARPTCLISPGSAGRRGVHELLVSCRRR